MFEIACYDIQNNLGIIGENGSPFIFDSQEAAYNKIDEIQRRPNKPELKLMWVRRCVGVYSQQPSSRCPAHP